MGTADPDYVKEFKKLDLYLRDLELMRTELIPGADKKGVGADDLKGLDKWSKQKVQLSHKLKTLRDGVDKLDEVKKTLAAGERDQEVIKLMSQNSKVLKEVTAMWTELKQILIEDEKKTGKKALDEKTLADRKKMTKNLGKEILDLTNRNSRVPGSAAPATTDADVDRLDEKKGGAAKRRDDRKKARDKRKKARGGDDGEMDDLGEPDKPPQPMSAQEQAFMEARDAAYQEQDAMLDEINKGLDELLELGEDMNKQLQMQQHMLDEVEKKMDDNIDKLKGVNQRMKKLLDDTGGIERWCPRLVLAIVVLALAGYIFTIVTGSKP